MVPLSIFLLLLGAMLICIELITPGQYVFGVIGGIICIASVIITILFTPLGMFILFGEIAALGVFFYAVFNYIKKHQLHGKLVLDETLAEDIPDIGNPDSFIGREGTAKTSLRPFGVVDFNGLGVDVTSDGMYIPENSRVKVTGVINRKIVVRPVN